MIFDRTLLLSDQQAVTVTAPSTNVIDLRATGRAYKHAADLKRDLGIGAHVPFLIQVTEAFTAAGAGTLTVELQTDDNEAFASPTTVWTSGAIGKATLVPGYLVGFVNYLPKGVNERYFRLNYTVGTGPMTAGKIVAGVVADVQTAPL
jgi:hypothetical protein